VLRKFAAEPIFSLVLGGPVKSSNILVVTVCVSTRESSFDPGAGKREIIVKAYRSDF
jgi:hypothetical protein